MQCSANDSFKTLESTLNQYWKSPSFAQESLNKAIEDFSSACLRENNNKTWALSIANGAANHEIQIIGLKGKVRLSLLNMTFNRTVILKHCQLEAFDIDSCVFQEEFCIEASEVKSCTILVHGFLKSVSLRGLSTEVLSLKNSRGNQGKIAGFFQFKDSKVLTIFSLENSIFENAQELDFSGSTFECPVTIELAAKKAATFKGSKFNGATSFRGHFHQTADFSRTTFFKTANFDGVRFEKKADFSNANFFQDASFSSSNFLESAIFKSAEFQRGVGFRGGVCGAFDFSHSTVTGKIDFSERTFSDSVNLDALTAGDINFTKANVQGAFSFRQGGVGFFNSKGAFYQTSVDFTGTTFGMAPVFSALPPKPPQEALPQNATFHNCTFRDVTSPDAEPRYRAIKFIMGFHHHDAEAYRFAALEIHSRRKRLRFKSEPVEFVASYLYHLANDYGESLTKPIIGWFLLLLVLTVAYSADNALVLDSKAVSDTFLNSTWLGKAIQVPIGSTDSCLLHFTYRGLIFSLQQSIGPLKVLTYNSGVLIPKTSWIQIIAVIHSIISTVLLYLFIAGIRKRFKVT